MSLQMASSQANPLDIHHISSALQFIIGRICRTSNARQTSNLDIDQLSANPSRGGGLPTPERMASSVSPFFRGGLSLAFDDLTVSR